MNRTEQLSTEATSTDTTGTLAVHDEAEIVEPARRPSVVRRVLTALFATAAIALGSLLMAAPASAAGTAAPDLYFCFKQSNGLPYANSPVHLYTSNGVWQRSGRTNSVGCGTWVDVRANTGYYARAYFSYSVGSAGYAWDGYTPARTVGSLNATYSLPTGTAYFYRIW